MRRRPSPPPYRRAQGDEGVEHLGARAACRRREAQGAEVERLAAARGGLALRGRQQDEHAAHPKVGRMPRRVVRVAREIEGADEATLRAGAGGDPRGAGRRRRRSRPRCCEEAARGGAAPAAAGPRPHRHPLRDDRPGERRATSTRRCTSSGGGAATGCTTRSPTWRRSSGPGGAVDEEAHRRGETLYGVGEKVPLHPPVISEGACSLLPDGDRPALLWTIDVDDAGEGTDVRVERAMVRSRAKLSYDGVQADLDAGPGGPGLRAAPRGRASCGRRAEQQRGGVSLPLPDQEVDLRRRAAGRCRSGSRCPSRAGTRRSRC